MGEIRWKKRDIELLFTATELFSVMAIYQKFKSQGKNYLDNLNIDDLQKLIIGRLDDENIPPTATEPLHALFDGAVKDFSEYLNNPEGFKAKVEERTKDPVRKFIDEAEFRDALKFVLVYRIVLQKKTTVSQAKTERGRILTMVLDECKGLLMSMVMSSAENLITAAEKHNLSGDAIGRLSLRIDELFNDGFKINLCLDGKPLDFDDDLAELLKEQKPKEDNSFNPMFG